MDISLRKMSGAETQTLVVFAAKADTGKDSAKKAVGSGLSPDVQKLLTRASEDGVFTGDKKETALYRDVSLAGAKNILFVGLGKTSGITSEQIRCAAAFAYAGIKSSKSLSAAISLDSLMKFVKDKDGAVQALAEGLWLSPYEYNELKKKPVEKKKELEEIVLLSSNISAGMNKAIDKAKTLSECQNFARRLGDTPANYMTPSILANEAVEAAKGTKLKVTVWDKARLKKEKFGGLLAVAKGSAEEPRFIIMEYKGGPASQKPIVYVGKGVTFDTGGISIKPSANMEEMKYDMCGAAAVIATMTAIARLKLKVNVIGLVPSTENMPGSQAWKPGDVFFARNGKSVEVFNTDAEGRLILADALAYGSELKPSVIYDAATLTGAILVGLGNTHSGVFTRDTKLMGKIQKAADATGELVWHMPLNDWHVEDTKGTHADWCNITSGRLAGSSTAAAFLEQFVEDGIPWAHFDIAGTAWNVANRFPYCPKKGASGIIMRTFVQLAESSGGKP